MEGDCIATKNQQSPAKMTRCILHNGDDAARGMITSVRILRNHGAAAWHRCKPL